MRTRVELYYDGPNKTFLKLILKFIYLPPPQALTFRGGSSKVTMRVCVESLIDAYELLYFFLILR